jgi:uncharacterized repeat protein (TIGR03803 family)
MNFSPIPACALTALGLMLGGAARADSFSTLASIAGSPDGFAPTAPLIDAGGIFYGTAPGGGSAGCGAVFAYNPATGTESVVYDFKGASDGCAPVGALLSLNGLLYGTTKAGGTAGNGTVFAINPSTNTETVLYAFGGGTDGAAPQASLIALNGLLYGTTSAGGSAGAGTVFSFNPQSQSETILYAFAGGTDGSAPVSPLLAVNDVLYGTTQAGGANHGGTVFSLPAAGGADTVLHSFGASGDGSAPLAGLIAVGKRLYGTASSGGADYGGLIYSVDPASGKEKTVYTFTGEATGLLPEAALVDVGGTLYGTTFGGGTNFTGAVFAFDPKKNTASVVYSFGGSEYDGANPACALLADGTALYGVTPDGGANQAGTLFSVTPATGAETIDYAFTGANNAESDGGLTAFKDTLYAAVAQGGTLSKGEVLSIAPATGTVTPVFSFSGNNGTFPSAAMLKLRGKLYGTAKQGGAYGNGAVYSFDPTTGAQKIVYSFTGGADGGTPYATLVAEGGMLYGTTVAGGTYGVGTIFMVNPETGAESAVYSFTYGNDGGFPFSGLIDVGGVLYGTAVKGGANYYGTLFSFDPSSQTLTTLYAFTGANDGGEPSATLLNVNGVLYGTALFGGPSNNGVVFQYSIANGTEAPVYAFAGGSDGNAPDTALLKKGKFLYGTTSGIFGGGGTVFKLNPETGKESVLHVFSGGADGGDPNSGMVEFGGSLYGATGIGGAANLGTVFTLTP